ncbi:hypothetical protein Z045_09120 [Rhodococcus pyridinivorans KG-16]|uniref:Chemotaxis protein n=1 Tax=Rhodococcus pyridinivorans KG-16 TaxID=1441730 RepID=A0A0V9ULA7_9NOCA|nr:hypothetical protein [Rhodococcus pyridinivorans]KSZ58794.1 hypothetical protein Z045_09120 [Rhodococcus pyridinivorans KG-16]
MVLPLIPAALIAIGAVTGGGGVALSGKGIADRKKAADQLRRAHEQYTKRRDAIVERVGKTNAQLETLGGQQQQALTDVVIRMAEFLRRHEKQVRENERLLADGLQAGITQVDRPNGLDLNLGGWLGGAMASVATGVGTASAVSAAATSFGVASTGAAISGLSGAAAQSAAMAWLGGGALSAGGGGVALGAAALNVVTIGPALLISGFVIKGQGQKALTEAAEFQTKIDIANAELGTTDTLLTAVDHRIDELRSVLGTLTVKAVAALDVLESEPFDARAHASRFQKAMALSVAVRDVAATPILDEDGELTENSANLTVRYRPMTEGDDRGAEQG